VTRRAMRFRQPSRRSPLGAFAARSIAELSSPQSEASEAHARNVVHVSCDYGSRGKTQPFSKRQHRNRSWAMQLADKISRIRYSQPDQHLQFWKGRGSKPTRPQCAGRLRGRIERSRQDHHCWARNGSDLSGHHDQDFYRDRALVVALVFALYVIIRGVTAHTSRDQASR